MSKLKVWRLERGLSQMELAQASGVTRWVIQLIESTLRCPTPNEVDALASVLGVPAEQLFGGNRAEGSSHGN